MRPEEKAASREENRTWLRFLLVSGVVCAVGAAAAGAQPASSPEQAIAARGEGLVLARCGVCHSTDLIGQQRLDRAKWEATVAKMRHWGAELLDEEAQVLVTYLSGRYTPTTPDILPPDQEPLVPFRAEEDVDRAAVHPVGDIERGSYLFATNCQACHGQLASGGAGPRLAGNPILSEEDRFWETVLHGRGAMPAWGAVLKTQEIADIHAWLQTIRQ